MNDPVALLVVFLFFFFLLGGTVFGARVIVRWQNADMQRQIHRGFAEIRRQLKLIEEDVSRDT